MHALLKKFGFAAMAASLFAAMPAMAEETYAKDWQMGFQEAATPVMEMIHDLHDLLNVVIFAVVVLVTALMAYVMIRFRASRNPKPAKWSHNTLVEIAWTAIPVLILVIIAVPSFRLLYFMDKTAEPEMTLKVTGYQWYWGYEYPEHEFSFDAIMIPDDQLQEGQPRLLATDNAIVLPVETDIRVLVTAADVMHSWAVPAFGVKKDAVPGRINETWVRIDKPGTYYGQCSELCGVNHAFMPIMVKAVSKDEYAAWVEQAKEQFAGTAATPIVAQVTDDTH